MHFREWEVWQWPSTDLDDGLAPSRRQAIIWTNAGLIQWRIYVALGGYELNIVTKTISP